jgi:NTE family protein
MSSSNNFEGDATTRFGLIYTRTQINELAGEWRVGFQLGDEPAVVTELHQPLDSSLRYFVSGKVGYRTRNVSLFDTTGDELARYYLRVVSAELGLGREFGAWGEGRMGYQRESGAAEINIGEPAPDVDIDMGRLFVRLTGDKLDNPYFPRSGQFGIVEYAVSREQYGSSSNYDQWLIRYTGAISKGANTFIGALAGSSTEDNKAPLEGLFELGGFLRLSGLQEDQLSGQHAGLISLIYMRRLTETRLIPLFNSYAGFSLETGNVWQQSNEISFDNTITAGSLFVGFDTPIGPVYLGYGRTETDKQSVYIYLGPRFTF